MTMASEWEQELLDQLKYVELLGELDLQQTLIQRFGERVADVILKQGVAQALHGIIKKYPTCLAMYLVTKGIYDYKEGNYWSSVAAALGVNAQHAHKYLGRFFEDFLCEHDLPLFPGLGGRRYVAIILLHGGIPYYSLDDFFAHILHPALSRPDLYGLQAKELIMTWLESGSQFNVDKPITRFLQHGGKVAVDFVARSLAMGQYYAEYGTVPSSEEIGLPNRVVSAYQKWAKNQTHTKQSTKTRLVRPEITLDPWGGSLFIELPSQVLSSTPEAGLGWWRVAEQEQIPLPLRVRWRNERWETESYEIELVQPATIYHVSLTTPDIKRTWHVQGLLPHLFVFDAINGVMIPLRDALPAKTFWLLYPQDQELHIEGGKKQEEFPPLIGAWSHYRVEEWDLSNATLVQLGPTSIMVEPDIAKLQPTLHGNEMSGLLHKNGEPRIFIGSPPDIHIPFSSQRDPNIEAQRWRVTVHKGGETVTRSFSLANLPYTVEQNILKLSSCAIELFGQEASGNYEISLRGPLGRDAIFSIAIVLSLHLTMGKQDLIRLPDGKGTFSSPQLTITTSDDLMVDSSDSAVRIEAKPHSTYTVLVPAPSTQAELVLYSKKKTSSVKIPLTLPLPIIHWMVVNNQKAVVSSDWQTREVIYPVAWLEQAENPRLLVSLTPIEGTTKQLSGKLLVRYSQHGEPHILRARGNAKKWLTFNLAEAMDSIRASRVGHTRVELELDSLPGQTQTIHLPVLRFTQALQVDKFHLDHCLVDDTWMLSLNWQDEHHLHNRFLRLWSLWQPWQPPILRPIPDTLQNNFDTEISKQEMPPGFYRVEIAVIDPWSHQEDPRPGQKASNTKDILLGSMGEVHSYLANLPDTILSSLQHALAVTTMPERLRALHSFDLYYHPRYVRQAFETLLILHEQITSEAEEQQIFHILQRHLVKSPIELLAFAAGHSLTQEQSVRWQFEELLSRLAPHLHLAQLLNQIHQSGSIALEELHHLVPTEQSDKHNKAETFAVLLEAGIQLQESGTETQLADTQQLMDLHNLYEELSEYHIDSIRQYLLEIGQYTLLKAKQEQSLAQQIREGKEAEEQQKMLPQPEAFLQKRIERGKQAYDQLTQANLRLVVSIARKYINRGLDLLDIIQEGNIGLMRAIDKFDVTKGYRFSTYATWWIRQAITRAIADQKSLVRFPVHVVEDLNMLAKAKSQLMQQFEHEPSYEDLAEHLQIPIEKVRQLLLLSHGTESLDGPFGDDTESTLGDYIPQEDSDPFILATKHNLEQQIPLLLTCLTQRQRTVLELRFGIGDDAAHTLEAVGQKLNVTRERVRQIEEKALRLVRNKHDGIYLEDFLV